MRKVEGGGSKQIIDITKNENLPLQVIQLDVNNDKSITEAINRIVTAITNSILFDHIPVFNQHSVFDTKDVDYNPVHRMTKARIPSVDHYEISICNNCS